MRRRMAALRLYGRLVAPITITRDLLSVTMPSHSLQEKKRKRRTRKEKEERKRKKRDGKERRGGVCVVVQAQNHGRTVAEGQKVCAYVMKTDSTCMW